MTELAERVAAVRAFNRMYTRVIGALDEGLVRTPYVLSEARVLFELAGQEHIPVGELRRRLDLDAGYASRLLARLADRGLVKRDQDGSDARRQQVGLTAAGREAAEELRRNTVEQVTTLLGRFDEDEQRRLVGAMAAIDSLLGEQRRPEALVLRPPRPGDFGWVIQRHGALYAREYGWHVEFEAMVARIVADFAVEYNTVTRSGASVSTTRQAAWIAELDGRPVGSVFCTSGDDPGTARLRLLFVDAAARGHGVGKRLVAECVTFARDSGYAAIELWTNDVLVAARAIYQKAGFTLVDSSPQHSFGADLVGETWRLDLRSAQP